MQSYFSQKINTLNRFLSYLYHRWQGVIEYRGIKLAFRPSVITWHLYKLIYLDKYELIEHKLATLYTKPDIPIIELGAGMGYISSTISKQLQPGVLHIALEPTPYLRDVIKENRRLNNVSFEILPFAYSSQDGVRHLYIADRFSRNSFTPTDFSKPLNVRAVSLSTLIQQYKLETFSLHADIEGAEVDLIENELPFLEKYCSRIIIELHLQKKGVIEVQKKLENSTFHLVDFNKNVYVYDNNQLQ